MLCYSVMLKNSIQVNFLNIIVVIFHYFISVEWNTMKTSEFAIYLTVFRKVFENDMNKCSGLSIENDKF